MQAMLPKNEPRAGRRERMKDRYALRRGKRQPI